jgi:hypothetical protein
MAPGLQRVQRGGGPVGFSQPITGVCGQPLHRFKDQHGVNVVFGSNVGRFFESANKRVIVSREVPIICAISSCFRASLSRGSNLLASPFLALHTGLRYLQDQRFAVGGADGQLHASLAEHVNTAWSLPLHEQDRAFGIGGLLDGFEGLQCAGRKIAE